jgi:hypothetical protein
VLEHLPPQLRERAKTEWAGLSQAQRAVAQNIAETIVYEQERLKVAVFVNVLLQQRQSSG